MKTLDDIKAFFKKEEEIKQLFKEIDILNREIDGIMCSKNPLVQIFRHGKAKRLMAQAKAKLDEVSRLLESL